MFKYTSAQASDLFWFLATYLSIYKIRDLFPNPDIYIRGIERFLMSKSNYDDLLTRCGITPVIIKRDNKYTVGFASTECVVRYPWITTIVEEAVKIKNEERKKKANSKRGKRAKYFDFPETIWKIDLYSLVLCLKGRLEYEVEIHGMDTTKFLSYCMNRNINDSLAARFDPKDVEEASRRAVKALMKRLLAGKNNFTTDYGCREVMQSCVKKFLNAANAYLTGSDCGSSDMTKAVAARIMKTPSAALHPDSDKIVDVASFYRGRVTETEMEEFCKKLRLEENRMERLKSFMCRSFGNIALSTNMSILTEFSVILSFYNLNNNRQLKEVTMATIESLKEQCDEDMFIISDQEKSIVKRMISECSRVPDMYTDEIKSYLFMVESETDLNRNYNALMHLKGVIMEVYCHFVYGMKYLPQSRQPNMSEILDEYCEYFNATKKEDVIRTASKDSSFLRRTPDSYRIKYKTIEIYEVGWSHPSSQKKKLSYDASKWTNARDVLKVNGIDLQLIQKVESYKDIKKGIKRMNPSIEKQWIDIMVDKVNELSMMRSFTMEGQMIDRPTFRKPKSDEGLPVYDRSIVEKEIQAVLDEKDPGQIGGYLIPKGLRSAFSFAMTQWRGERAVVSDSEYDDIVKSNMKCKHPEISKVLSKQDITDLERAFSVGCTKNEYEPTESDLRHGCLNSTLEEVYGVSRADINCFCNEDENMMWMTEKLNRMVRSVGPSGAVTKDPINKIKDSLVRHICRVVFGDKNSKVWIKGKSGRLVKTIWCEKTSEAENNVISKFASLLAARKIKQDLINEVKECLMDGDRDDTKSIQIVGSVNNILVDCLEFYRAGKYKGWHPCMHGQVVFSDITVQNWYLNIKTVVKRKEEALKEGKSMPDSEIKFYLDKDVDIFKKKTKYFEKVEKVGSSYISLVTSTIRKHMVTMSDQKCLQSILPNIDWLVSVLSSNKWFRSICIEHCIAEAIEKSMLLNKGIVVQSLTPEVNIIVNNVSSDNSQIVWFLQNRFTHQMTTPKKMECRMNTSRLMAMPMTMLLISNCLEQRDLINSCTLEDIANADDAMGRYVQIKKMIHSLKQSFLSQDMEAMIKSINRAIRRNNLSKAETTNEIIMYMSSFVHPVICENNKNLNAVLQMSRYMYSANFASYLNVAGVAKKLFPIVRGYHSQNMYMILLACFMKSGSHAMNSMNRLKTMDYSEIRCVAPMVDFFCNLMTVPNAPSFMNVIYYLHAFDRMEMDRREVFNAHNMFNEKAVEWKMKVNDCLSSMCDRCQHNINDFETPMVTKRTDPVSMFDMPFFIDCEDCRGQLLHLENLFGFQIVKRSTPAAVKQYWKWKQDMCCKEFTKVSYMCWETTQQVAYYNKRRRDEDRSRQEPYLDSDTQISDLASTTNTVTKFVETIDPEAAQARMRGKRVSDLMDVMSRRIKTFMRVNMKGEIKDDRLDKMIENEINDMLEHYKEDSELMEECRKAAVGTVRGDLRSTGVAQRSGFFEFCTQPEDSFHEMCKSIYAQFKQGPNVEKKRRKEFMKHARKEVAAFMDTDFNSQKTTSERVELFEQKLMDSESTIGSIFRTSQNMWKNTKLRYTNDVTGAIFGVDYVNEIPDWYRDEWVRFKFEFEDIREQEMKFPGIDLSIRRRNLVEEMKVFRDANPIQNMKTFANCFNKYIKYTSRWMLESRTGLLIAPFVATSEQNIAGISEEDQLDVHEWFVLMMFVTDYNMGPVGGDDPEADLIKKLRVAGFSHSPHFVVNQFLDKIDMAVHSSREKFKKRSNSSGFRLIADASDKVITGLIDLARKTSITSVVQIVHNCCLDQDVSYLARCAPKQQFGPIRDLVILEIRFRVMQFYCEAILKKSLKSERVDMMTKPDQKMPFLTMCQEEYKKQQAQGSSGLIVVSGDNSGWGPKHSNMQFASVLPGIFMEDTFNRMATECFQFKSMRKRIHITDTICKAIIKMMRNAGLKFKKSIYHQDRWDVVDMEGNSYETMEEIMDHPFFIKKEVAYIIMHQLRFGQTYMSTFSHMGQGIHHMGSSQMHVMGLEYWVYRMNELFPDVRVETLCSSDDYAIMYSSNVKVGYDEFKETVKQMEEYRRVLLISFNIMDSDKTLLSPGWISEIYSEFITPQTGLTPYIKQLCALVTAPCGITPLDENVLSIEMSKNLFESGGSLLGVNFALMCRNIKNEAMGNKRLTGSYDTLKVGLTNHHDGWVPWINNVKAISMIDIAAEVTSCMVEHVINIIEICLKRGLPSVAASCVIESIRDLDLEVRSNKKSAITKTENSIGNPVKFRPPLKLKDLHEKISLLKSSSEREHNENIKTICDLNKRARDFESAMGKFAQGLSSSSIICNLVGVSAMKQRNMCRMARGGYYWKKEGVINGPSLTLDKTEYLSISDVDRWTVSHENWEEEYKNAIEILKMSVPDWAELKQKISCQVSALTGRSEYAYGRRLGKVKLIRNRGMRLMRNDPNTVVAYVIDKYSTLACTDIDLNHIEMDIDILKSIQPKFFEKVSKMTIVGKDDLVEILRACEQFRSSRQSTMNVTTQVSGMKKSGELATLVASKIQQNRMFSLTAIEPEKPMKEDKDVRLCTDLMTILNQTDKSIKMAETYNTIVNSDDFNESLVIAQKHYSLHSLQSDMKRKVNTIQSGISRSFIQVDEKIKSGVSSCTAGRTIMDRYFKVYEIGKTRVMCFLICCIDGEAIRCSSNAHSSKIAAQLVSEYIDVNKRNLRPDRPKTSQQFWSRMVSTGNALRIQNIDGGIVATSKLGAGTKCIEKTSLNTSGSQGSFLKGGRTYYQAVKRNRECGLSFGRTSAPFFCVSPEVLVGATMGEDDDLSALLFAGDKWGEFIEDNTIRDNENVLEESFINFCRKSTIGDRSNRVIEEPAKAITAIGYNDFFCIAENRWIDSYTKKGDKFTFTPQSVTHTSMTPLARLLSSCIENAGTGVINKRSIRDCVAVLTGISRSCNISVELWHKIQDVCSKVYRDMVRKDTVGAEQFMYGSKGTRIIDNSTVSSLLWSGYKLDVRTGTSMTLDVKGIVRSTSANVGKMHERLCLLKDALKLNVFEIDFSKSSGKRHLRVTVKKSDAGLLDPIIVYLRHMSDKRNDFENAMKLALCISGNANFASMVFDEAVEYDSSSEATSDSFDQEVEHTMIDDEVFADIVAVKYKHSGSNVFEMAMEMSTYDQEPEFFRDQALELIPAEFEISTFRDILKEERKSIKLPKGYVDEVRKLISMDVAEWDWGLADKDEEEEESDGSEEMFDRSGLTIEDLDGDDWTTV